MAETAITPQQHEPGASFIAGKHGKQGTPAAELPPSSVQTARAETTVAQQQHEPAPSCIAGKKGTPAADLPPCSVGTPDTSCSDVPTTAIRVLMTSASRGFLTSSKRGHRIFRKEAGTLCQRARELDSRGLLWSKAAWASSLQAAMVGLRELADTADAELPQGFENVLASVMHAHPDGLQRPASACRGTRSTPARPAAATTAARKQVRPPAGGATRKAREAREPLATYLFGDKCEAPVGAHDRAFERSLLCEECSRPAAFAQRGGKEGGNLKCFCGLHRPFTRCFQIETARAEWARACQVYKLKAELARALDEESQRRANQGCNVWQQDGSWRDETPKSRHLIAKLLMMGGIESNPGPSSVGTRQEGKRPLALGGETPVLDGAAVHLPKAPPSKDPRAETSLLLHDAPRTMELTAVPSAGEIEVMETDQDSEATSSAPVAPRTGRPAPKKWCKRTKANPVPVEEAARVAVRGAVETHRRTLETLRAPRAQRDGQPVHQTELGDFGGPLDAPPVARVTDASIANVGALVDRLQAKRDAKKAAAREERLKRYKRRRPLGVPPGEAAPLARTTLDLGPLAPAPLRPPVALPSQPESPALSPEQPSAAPPPELPVVKEEQSPAPPPTNQPPAVAAQEPTSPLLATVVLEDQPPEPQATAPPHIGEVQPEMVPEMVPGQPPAVAPSPPFAHQKQAPLDLPNQPPAADTFQPAAAEPSTDTSSALAPLELLAAAPEEPSPSVEPAAAEWGPGWCKKLQDALRQQRAARHAVLVAEDVNDVGAKRWGSFRDVVALVAHRRSIGPYANLYEVIQDDACWRIYFDLDFSAPVENPGDFDRRLQAFHLVRDRFLTSLLNLLEAALRFQVCEVHGEARPPKQGFEYSVHEVLEGFYLRGLEARRAFGRAFGSFLENPPNDLKSSVELLRKDGGSAYMWDGSIYGRHRSFRLLRSSKFGDRFRPLVPSEGSSEAIPDHLICLYSEAELAGSTEISADLLGEWATVKPGPPAPPRVGAFRSKALTLDEASTSRRPSEDLSEQERAVLLARYQEDHAGAEISRVVQERPGVFFVHFRAPEPTCCISGRRHASPGNQNPYLIYKRDEPRIARYQCFANSCRGECRVLPLDVLSTLGWTEDYVENLRMRPYPVFQLQHVGKRTILARAKKGVGKSKALKAWEVAMIEKNPGLSLCSLGANISLSQKYREDLVDAGVKDVVFYQEAPPGPINAPRVVCCINSIHRVRGKMDVVVIDEMDMVLANLNSEVMTQRGRVLSCLEELVAGAKVVIGLDANIDSARVMEYLFMARPDADLHAIRNRGLYPADRHATIRVLPVGSGLRECIGTAVRDVLDRVARGTKVVCPSTSKRFVKQLEQDFNVENPPAESDRHRHGIFLHADKRSKVDEDFFQKAMADPDTYLEADLVAFSPKLGPGVSKEKPHAEQTVAFALNGLTGPPVQTLLQQHARFRTVTHSTIYYKQVMSSAVDLPRSTEAVFQAIERDNQQIVQMLGDASGFHYLMGTRSICDRSSASSVLYANNILEKVESYLEYLTKLKADLESQGFVVTVEHIDPQGNPGRPLSEVPLGFDADSELLDDEDWRAKYIISSEQYEILCEKPENLTPREQLQEYLYELVMNEYKVVPRRVDHAFYLRFCDDSNDAKRTRDAHANYLRFREHRFAVLVGDLDTALEAAMSAGVLQEYVKQVQNPGSRVPIAVRVLAFLLECGEEELDHELEQWEVSEERVQAAYAELIGPTKKRLKSIFNLYGFTQQTSRASKAAEGRVNEHWAQKRNAVANVLKAGLGIELQVATEKSGGKFKTPHLLTPAIYRGLHERYGWLDAETAAAEPECTIRP